ncbi:MAG: SDR family oxidoreductase [Gammaproteobacteria bacterium]|nr:MAG: SDR family oxidoreductase [Gammaproteobacteria bacterium]
MPSTRPVAIVTGSSSGVGAACVQQLAARGWNPVVNFSRSDAAAREVAKQCEAAGAEVLVVKADVAEDADCRRLVKEVMDRFGRVDALVNNAGTTKFVNHADLDGLDKADFLHIYSVNTVGAFQMARAAEPHLRAAGRAAIVNVASIAGIKGIGSSIAYAASKGAMITMTKSLARVLGPQIRVNAVCPGFIQGEWLRQGMGAETYDRSKAFLEKSTPLQATATADTVAETIISLIENASLVTGETLLLDGGHHLM